MKNYKIFAFADEADKDFSGQIAAMKENGLNGLEIRGVNGKNIKNVTIAEAKELKQQLDDNGLSVWAIGSPSGKIGVNDDFTPHFDEFKHMLELADILGADNYRLFSFFIPKDEEASSYKDEVLERLNKFCEYAKGSGIVLCHENEKVIYGDIVNRCVEIHENIPALKAVFDPANFIQCNEDTLKAFDRLKSYIHYMHIKDAKASGDVVACGDGVGNIKQLIELYDGEVFSVEPHLTHFVGLSNLSQDGEERGIGGYNFASTREAFDYAIIRFKEILEV